jgi:type III restriction enzyme
MVADAAAAETDQGGNPYPEHERLVVFPGIELTLATPSCQVIMVLDPDLSQDILNQVLGTLVITPTAHGEPKTTPTLALHNDLTLEEICRRLDGLRINPAETNPAKFQFLKNRFILLPNVKAAGHKTFVREGFHPHFVAMSCVGGYIEGCFYQDLSQSNRNKVEGKISEWGNKRLGVFQTSDCRSAVQVGGVLDYPDLGRWPTWVKWSKPSAEALRQACLASASRISHVQPSVPLHQIVGVEISDSLFLGEVNLLLNPQFNALIGGRGTGKSSLLEYIRWALGDDPLADSVDELPNFQKRRKSLIDHTLKPKNSTVTVYYKKNEVIYRIVRSTVDRDDCVSINQIDHPATRVPLSEVRKDFPLVSYAQKQLSCVGTLPSEIKRLVTDPIKEALDSREEYLNNEVIPQLKEQRMRAIRLEFLQSQIDEAKRKIANKREQVQALQGQLNELNPEQQRVISAHELLTEQRQVIERIESRPNTIKTFLEDVRRQLQMLNRIAVGDRFPDGVTLNALEQEAENFVNTSITSLSRIISEVDNESWKDAATKDAITELKRNYDAHKALYEEYIKETAKNQQQLSEIQKLNKEISDSETAVTAFEAERGRLKTQFDQVGSAYWESLLETTKTRGDQITAQCATISDQASQRFRASLHLCGDGRILLEALNDFLRGRNIKDSDSKISSLVDAVTSAESPLEKWAEVIEEFNSLISAKEATELPEIPAIRQAQFSTANLESIRSGCTQEALERIRYINIPDKITFAFKIGKDVDGNDNFIPFESASPGQQATCLLSTLLSQSGAPLLIDQPEEDLDNEQIQVLSEKLSLTKHNRQIVFVSHNANIVVNGDAELVACFGYTQNAGNAQGRIAPIGSIDCAPVREAITNVMEGGKVAFEMRRDKYGF